MGQGSPTPLAPTCDATDAVAIAKFSLSLFPVTDPKAGASPTEASPDSWTSAPTAAIQVFDGDGLSESERETLSRLASERAAAEAAKPRSRTLSMKWTKEAMEDFQSMHGLDLNQAILDQAMKDMGVPNELLTATK
jgi:hypothetical protein